MLLGVSCDITKAYYDLGSVPEGTTHTGFSLLDLYVE
jgi:hypothetical protein